MNIMMRLRKNDPIFNTCDVKRKFDEQQAYWIKFVIHDEYDDPIAFQYFVESIQDYFLSTDDLIGVIEERPEDFTKEVISNLEGLSKLQESIMRNVIKHHETNFKRLNPIYFLYGSAKEKLVGSSRH
ncbi:MAG: hypothetical protein V3V61_01035 [Gammaproteobacteria bacterium]